VNLPLGNVKSFVATEPFYTGPEHLIFNPIKGFVSCLSWVPWRKTIDMAINNCGELLKLWSISCQDKTSKIWKFSKKIFFVKLIRNKLETRFWQFSTPFTFRNLNLPPKRHIKLDNHIGKCLNGVSIVVHCKDTFLWSHSEMNIRQIIMIFTSCVL